MRMEDVLLYLIYFEQIVSLCATIYSKVNWCLARYSPRATTTNQMSRQGLAQNDQKCQFRHFGQRILILTKESKGFGSHITEKNT